MIINFFCSFPCRVCAEGSSSCVCWLWCLMLCFHTCLSLSPALWHSSDNDFNLNQGYRMQNRYKTLKLVKQLESLKHQTRNDFGDILDAEERQQQRCSDTCCCLRWFLLFSLCFAQNSEHRSVFRVRDSSSWSDSAIIRPISRRSM